MAADKFSISLDPKGLPVDEVLARVRAQRANVKPESIKYELYQHVLKTEPTSVRRDGMFLVFEWVLECSWFTKEN